MNRGTTDFSKTSYFPNIIIYIYIYINQSLAEDTFNTWRGLAYHFNNFPKIFTPMDIRAALLELGDRFLTKVQMISTALQ